MNNFFKIILLGPATLLYGLIITLRNKFYDWHIFRSTEFPLPVIGVGNLTVGGTGKTPHTEMILSMLKDEMSTAVLSRGYMRKTKGFRYVEVTDTPDGVGDEPLQIKQKFPEVTVAVDANRTAGIRRLMCDAETLNAVILDDAFQHRQVRPALSMLLIDYNRPIGKDCLLPLGRLRDRKNQLHRADLVFITKCPPQLTPIEQRIIVKNMRLYPYQQLYLTTFAYAAPQAVFEEQEQPSSGENILLTGIASPAPLVAYLTETYGAPVEHLAFSDHHAFTPQDVRKINEAAQRHPEARILTTEKDATRLRVTKGLSNEVQARLFYLPVTVHFLAENGEEKFRRFITNYVRKNKRNNILHASE
jgi:tetraacyldisaccharide 4'-kinase